MAHGDGFGMASPGPMSPEPPPAGPQARIGRRVSCTAQDFSYAATDATAHSNVNPFPMHAGVTGAQLGYYSAHAHPHAQASHAHPQVHFDPQSSSFTIPSGGGSGGGAGESPDLDGGLPNGSRRRSSAGVKGVAMRLRHIFVHKGRPTKWVAALAAAALMMAVLLVVAFRSRGGGASGVTAAADSYQQAAPARTPVVMSTTTARPQRAAADGVAASPGTVQEEEQALALPMHSHPPATLDSGSRHAPDVVAAASNPDSEQGSVEPSAEQRAEMDWLAGLIGCASPLPPLRDACAAASSRPAPPAAAAAAPLPPLLRVRLLDGRVYTGRLHCTDSRANLVLAHASQEAGVIDSTRVGGFQVGQILVAWKLVDTIHCMTTNSDTTTAAATTATPAPHSS